ncbi:MAG: transglutaminaseTgpA domain-containing protein [Acidimicrobiales bacterium]|nr:transglutaminaseTgpA domain-containing protein [Acidimicrobiales bacterium]
MATTETELKALEEDVLDRLTGEAGDLEAGLDRAADAPEEIERPEPVARIAIAMAFPVIATAVMTGGVFSGVSPRIYGAVAGLLGIALAVLANRQRRLTTTLLIVGVGVFAIGLLMVVPTGVGNLGRITTIVKEANTQGDLTRPPVPFIEGWHAVLGWLMAVVGFSAAWVAFAFRKPALALVIPVPFAALGGISVPKDQQVASGIAVLVLFVVGLVLLSSNSGLEGDEKPTLAYELRNAVRSVLVIIPVTVVLILASQLDFLFPKPAVNPAEEPQKPKTTPLSKVVDRPLFRVTSPLTGPWRMGSLDEYKAEDGNWRLAAVTEADVRNVPKDGIVDRELASRITARFEIQGLTGAVLPGLSNPTGISAKGIVPAFDFRSNNIRLASGTLESGQEFTVFAAGLPSIADLQGAEGSLPANIARFAEGVGTPPPAVADLLTQANALPTQWDRFDFLRNYVLDNVVATGLGVPVEITPARVDELLTKLEATPFEIVATQAMLARWIGVPSRIAFGFDNGEKVGTSTLEVRPKHGITYVEVYFPGLKWIPVVGVPKKAKPSVSSDPGTQQSNPNILPSEDVNIQVFLPLITPPQSVFGQQLLRVVLIVVPIALLIMAIYSTYPALRKLRTRSKRRSAALAIGPRARIALAYAEFRDASTDYGFAYPTDTPLMYLERFIDDDEHTELAWLVTRVLWGDLQDDASLELAVAAEELSRSLKRRVGSAQPATVRFVAAVSRLSLRNPFAPDLNATLASGGKEPTDELVAV